VTMVTGFFSQFC